MTSIVYLFYALVGLLTFVTMPIYIWYFAVALLGSLRKKRYTFEKDESTRFAVIICARHEQAVIGNLLQSLAAQNYPQDRYDVFVVADNCTDDDTAGVAAKNGAIVWQRFDTEHVGKGYALRWAIEKLRREYAGKYDAYCLFDADNLVDADFLRTASGALAGGAQIIEGNRCSKNPYDSWVAGGHAIYWYMLNRFFHRAKNNLGFSCMVSGTGFAFRADLLEPNGWQTQTIVEDCEFSIREIANGRKVILLDDAIFYDEQPTSFMVSLRQRYRWIVGAVQCTYCCLPLLLRKLRTPQRNRSMLDMVFYVLMPIAASLSLLSTLCTIVALLLQPGAPMSVLWYLIPMLLSTYFGPMLVAIFSVWGEQGPGALRRYMSAILMYPIFLFPMALLSPVAVLRPKTTWVPIVHSDARTLEQVEK